MISQDKRKRRKYEERQKAILDYNQSMKEAHEEGIAIGRKQKAIAIAKNFIAIGLDYSTIVQGTGLTLEEVVALANGSDLPL